MVAGTKKAEGALGGFVGRAKSIGSTLGGALGFIGATAAVTAFIGSVRTSMKEIDKLGDDSKKLGIGVENLQLLAYAAGQSGVQAESLNKAFAKMSDNIGEALVGTKAQKDAFAALGLSAETLEKKSPKEAFLDIADALNKVPGQAMKTKLGMDIFGRAAVDLLPLLAEGREGIEKLFAERGELGLLSAADVKRVQEMDDAWNKMAIAVKQLTGELAVALSPALEDIANQVTDLAPKIRDLVEGASGKEGKGLAVQQAAAAVGRGDLAEAMAHDTSKEAPLGFLFGGARTEDIASLFGGGAKRGAMTPEKLAELGKLSSEMESAMDAMNLTPGQQAALDNKATADKISSDLTDSLTPDLFAAGKDADKLFGRFIKPAAGNVVDMLKKADAELSAALASSLGEDSFTGDALGTAAKLLDTGINSFAEASGTAQKRLNDLATQPIIGQAAAIQGGTAEAFSQARQNFADQQKAEQMKLQKDQLKTLEKIEKNTGLNLKEFQTAQF